MGIPNFWLGRADPTYHTFTITFATTATGTGTATITHGTKTVTHTYANLDTAAVIAAAVYAALNASTIPEFSEISWTYPGTGAVVTGTYIEPGVPGEISAATTGGTGTTVAVANVIAPTGPNFINNAANFSLGLPDGTHDVIFQDGPACLYGFASSGWTADPNVIWRGSYTEAFGLPRYRSPGSSGQSYLEFRKRFFDLPGALNVIGIGDGEGPSMVNVSLEDASELRVYNTGPAGDSGAVVNIFPVTGNTPTTIGIFGGSVSIGWEESTNDTGTVIGAVEVNSEDATVTIGRDITIDHTKINGGEVVSHATNTRTSIREGTYTQADGQIDNLDMTSGTCYLDHAQGAGDVIILTMEATPEFDAPKLDLSRTKLYKKFENGTVTDGAVVYDPFGVCQFTTVAFDIASAKASTIGEGYSITAAPL